MEENNNINSQNNTDNINNNANANTNTNVNTNNNNINNQNNNNNNDITNTHKEKIIKKATILSNGVQPKSNAREILEWVYCVIIAVVLALLVRYFIGTPTIVQQKSMYPTLKPEQRLILNRIPRTLKQMPKRGDIITFEEPSEGVNTIITNLENPVAIYHEQQGIFNKFRYNILEIGKKSYIKRVIGLPGEHIKIQNGKVYINDKELEENYLKPDVKTEEAGPYSDLIVPEGCVFAMGDNRGGSTDCRRFGCIPLEKIESKVAIRFWPLNLFGKID